MQNGQALFLNVCVLACDVLAQHCTRLMGEPVGHMHTFEWLLQLWRFQSLLCPLSGREGGSVVECCSGGALKNGMEICHVTLCL